MDGPGTQRDGAVTAGGGEAVLVPEQHAQMCPVVVRRHEEASVHVGVAARFEAQEPPQALDVGVADCVDPPFGHGRARDRDLRLHEPERLPRRVIVDGFPPSHWSSLLAPLASTVAVLPRASGKEGARSCFATERANNVFPFASEEAMEELQRPTGREREGQIKSWIWSSSRSSGSSRLMPSTCSARRIR